MFENSPKQPATEQEPQMKSYKSSLDQVVDYLEQRTNEMRQRRLESKEQTLEEIATNVGDLFRGFNFFKEKGASLKTIGKETINNILKNPGSWEDFLTQGAANAPKTVAEHMREELEKKAEIKSKTVKSLLNVEEEEQRLAAMRANLEAAEVLLQDRKRVLTEGQKFDTIDNTESLKNKGEQMATHRRESGQRAAEGFFANLFGSL